MYKLKAMLFLGGKMAPAAPRLWPYFQPRNERTRVADVPWIHIPTHGPQAATDKVAFQEVRSAWHPILGATSRVIQGQNYAG